MTGALDTIFALSSGRGRAGVAVARVSGPAAGDALVALAGPGLPQPRKASRRRIVGEARTPVDDGLVLWFPGPASFTGEDVAEFHVHGGRAVIDAVLAALGRLPRLRPAEAGEFTRRAVENGKFDLTQAEALADLINAETEAQRSQALLQYEGSLGSLYEGWRNRLIRAAAWAEAAIDFVEEEIPADAMRQSRSQVSEIVTEIQTHLNDARRGEILREGFRLTVIGPPNSGKSSLLNALAQRDVAIVSEIPGTTRDVLEVHLDLGGYPLIVADTAGLRETQDALEREGVRRALARAEQGDAILEVLDATLPEQQFGRPPSAAPAIRVWNKIDISPAPGSEPGISVRTGEGMERLLKALHDLVEGTFEAPHADAALTRPRHRHALTEAVMALERSREAQAPELIAEELRLAMRHIGRITGRVDVEDLLDAVFRDFCIGK